MRKPDGAGGLIVVTTAFWQSVVEWLQVFAAIVTIAAAPWVVSGVKSFFQGEYLVECQRSVAGKRSVLWNIKLRNKTKFSRDHEIVIYSEGPNIEIYSAIFAGESDKMVDRHLELKTGKIYLFSNFWPRNRVIDLAVRTSSMEIPQFESSTSNVKLNINEWNSYFGEFFTTSLSLTRFRLTWLAAQFSIITLVCILRIIYLGYFES